MSKFFLAKLKIIFIIESIKINYREHKELKGLIKATEHTEKVQKQIRRNGGQWGGTQLLTAFIS